MMLALFSSSTIALLDRRQKGRQFLGRHLEGAVADERDRTP
jgi:hypothetical protein